MGEVLVSGSVGHLFGVEGWCFKHIAEAVGWIQFYSAVNDVYKLSDVQRKVAVVLT